MRPLRGGDVGFALPSREPNDRIDVLSPRPGAPLRPAVAAVAAGAHIAHDDPVAARDSSRLVYSSGAGRVCPRCGWPTDACRCSTRGSDAPVPVRVVAKLRVEKAGRGGKAVTVVYDLPRNAAFLKDLARELKQACGAGGTIQEDAIEIQGDLRDRIRDLLLKKGFGVKG